MATNKFLKIWLIAFALLFCGTVALNFFIDPYLLYDVSRMAGVNKIKPKAGTHSNQSKIHSAHRQNIDVLIIGNSRPEMGIDPDHPYFKKNKLKVYNLGLPGSSISTQYGYALDILRAKDAKIVLIAVDFIDYITSEKDLTDPYSWPPQKTSNDNRRKFNWNGSDNPEYFYQHLKDLYIPLISLGTLQDSFLTLFGQRASSPDLLNNGFNPARDMNSMTLTEGVRRLFDQKIPQIVTSFTSRSWKTYTPGYQWSPDFNTLQFLLNHLQAKGIKTKVFINPYHIKYLEIIEHAGLGQEFALWKRQLTKIVAETSKDNNITLWNFSDPSHYISESILNAGKRPLIWFWEPAHYRKELGDLMVNTLFGNQASDMKNKFGYQMNPANIESHLLDYRVNFKEYLKNHLEESNHVKSFFPPPENNIK